MRETWRLFVPQLIVQGATVCTGLVALKVLAWTLPLMHNQITFSNALGRVINNDDHESLATVSASQTSHDSAPQQSAYFRVSKTRESRT